MVVAAAFILLALTTPPTVGPQHYVIDQPGVLTNATTTWVAQNLQAFQEQTGHPVFVVIARSRGEAPAENFAGDDGAVLFLWLHEHDADIVVGSRMQLDLNGAVTAQILDGVVRPRMRREDADGAAAYGVDAIVHAIAPQYANVAPPKATPLILFGRGFMYTAVWLVFAAIVVSLIVRVITWVR
ncbi:MAG TPA: TPM domain-containing protein [Candidatus Cybelea sp.]|nr:TPM domain-containing protein [Candidatus Cybelea sp.]